MRALTRAGAVTVLLVVTLGATPAAAHDEREPRMPDGTGSVPAYRTDGPQLLVCKTDRSEFDTRIAGFPAALKELNVGLWDECQRTGHRHIQDAVDAVRVENTI